MSTAYRRLVLKPAGLDQSQSARLAKALESAIENQRRLAARSAHVLVLEGSLREDEDAFWVAHEPAVALRVDDLFDRQPRDDDEEALLGWASALLDILQAARSLDPARPVVHGGLCPGVLVLDAESGTLKVTDFGFAPAICEALGPDAYKGLCVETPASAESEPTGTGGWEVLGREVADRDGRLCAFIDPDKYGGSPLHSFEPSGDLFAAGVLLYLLGHHRHPYFPDEPNAHRIIDMVELYLPAMVPSTVFRDDFREQTDTPAAAWCDLVAELTARSPTSRPSPEAESVTSYLSLRPPVDAAKAQRHRFESVLADLQNRPLPDVAWSRVQSAADMIVEGKIASPGVVKQAGAVLELVEAWDTLRGDDWSRAGAALERLRSEAEAPPGVEHCAEKAAALFDRNRAVAEELDAVDELLRDSAARELPQVYAELQSAQARLEDPSAHDALVPAVLARLDGLRQTLPEHLARLETELEAFAHDAEACLDVLRDARQAEQWDEVEKGLAQAARLAYWPSALVPQRDEIARALQDHKDAILRENRERAETLLKEGKEKLRIRPVHRDDLHAALQLAEAVLAIPDRTPDQGTHAEHIIRKARNEIAALEQDAEGALHVFTEQEEAISRAESLARSDDPTEVREAFEIARELTQSQFEDFRNRAGAIAALEAEALVDQCTPEALLEAEGIANRLIRSRAQALQVRGEEILASVGAAVAEHRGRQQAVLREATELAGQGAFAEATERAAGVAKDPLVDDEEQASARRLLAEIDAQQLEAEQARQKAVADFDQAEAALGNADLSVARNHAEAVVANPRADRQLRDDAEQIIETLHDLEPIAALIAEGDAVAALARIDSVIESGGAFDAGREAAERLRNRAEAARARQLLDSIESHLTYRADQEDTDDDVETLTVRPDESLPAPVPEWIQSSISSLDGFVRGCATATKTAPPAAALAPGQRLGDKYEIVECLGRGGMGEVYRARDLTLDREVALKLGPPAGDAAPLAEAVQREAKAIASLNHAHIMHVNSFAVLDGRACFDTDYIHGQDLAAYADATELSARRIAAILAPVARALAHAHAQGVLHRDLKPQNIYIADEEGEGPWLIDFGLARMRTFFDARANTGLCGTPGFIAPEVISSMGEHVDHRADVFALGCVLYRLLVGDAPFQDPSTGALAPRATVSCALLNVLRGRYTPIDEAALDMRDDLRAVCRRAMSPEPDDRYADATQMADALEQIVRAIDEEAARAEWATAQQAFDQRRRNEPAELEDLQAARTLAEPLTRSAFDEIRSDAAQRVDEIDRLAAGITQQQQDAKARLAEAQAGLEAGKFRTAIVAAGEVVAVPYVPDLHPEAKEIQEEAQTKLESQKQKSKKKLLVAGGAVGALAAAIGAGVMFFTGGDPVVPPTPPPVPNGGNGAPPPSVPLSPSPEAVAALLKTGRASAPDDVRPFVQSGGFYDLSEVDASQVGVAAKPGEPTTFATTVKLTGRPEFLFDLEFPNTSLESAQPAWDAVRQALNDHRNATLGDWLDTQLRRTLENTLTGTPFPADLSISRVSVSLGSEPNEAVAIVVNHASSDIELSLPAQVRLNPQGAWQVDPPWDDPTTALRPQLLARYSEAALRVVAAALNVATFQPYFASDPAPLRMGAVTTDQTPATVTLLHGGAAAFVVPLGYANRRLEALGAQSRLQQWIAAQQTTAVAAVVQTLQKELDATAPVLKAAIVGTPGDTAVVAVGDPNQTDQSTTLLHEWKPASLAYTSRADSRTRFDTWLKGVISGMLTVDDLNRIKALLQTGWLANSPVTLTKTAEGKLHATAAFPWAGTDEPALQLADAPSISALAKKSDGTWDHKAIQRALSTQLSSAAGKSAAGLEWFLASWRDRKRLEDAMVQAFPAAGPGQPRQPMQPAAAWQRLTELARIKWHDPGFQPQGDLAGWTQNQLQAKLADRMGKVWRFGPNRFIEYFWGPRFVHAIFWYADDSVVEPYYVQLAASGPLRQQMQDAAGPTGWKADSSKFLDKMGETLLDPIVSTSGFFPPEPVDGTFAVAVAPDGPLLFLPFAQLGVTHPDVTMRLTIQNAGKRSLTASMTRLADLCTGQDFLPAFTAFWTLPSLLAPSRVTLKPAVWEPAWRMVDAADGNNGPPFDTPRGALRNLAHGARVMIPIAGTLISTADVDKLTATVLRLSGDRRPPQDAGFWQGRLPQPIVLLSDPVTESP